MLSTARRPLSSNPAPVLAVSASISRGLEWLWQELRGMRQPDFLDCGDVHARTLNILLSRAGKMHIGGFTPWLAGGAPELWDTSKRAPIYLVADLLARFPAIPLCSLGAVFCWQLLDLIPQTAQAAVVGCLLGYLRPGGALFCLLREPGLAKGADVVWGLEDLTTLSRHGEGGLAFPYPALTNRQMEQLSGSGNVKSFLTRAGMREVLIVKSMRY